MFEPTPGAVWLVPAPGPFIDSMPVEPMAAPPLAKTCAGSSASCSATALREGQAGASREQDDRKRDEEMSARRHNSPLLAFPRLKGSVSRWTKLQTRRGMLVSNFIAQRNPAVRGFTAEIFRRCVCPETCGQVKTPKRPSLLAFPLPYLLMVTAA